MPAQDNLITQIDLPGLAVIPLGGQSELGQVLWVISYKDEILVIDAGASYPTSVLPGVDLLLPNTSFLEANQNRICAVLLTNANEEYSGAVSYLVQHIKVPKIMAPKFVACMLEQLKHDLPGGHALLQTKIETVEIRHSYQIGSFVVEWIRVNDAVAEACALRISTGEGTIIYTTSFKLDQTPVDGQIADISRLAQLGDEGVTLLIGPSAGVERAGYSESELVLYERLSNCIEKAQARVIVLMSGTNTYRLQILLDLAKQYSRKTLLMGDALTRSAVASAMTGNLIFDPEQQTGLKESKNIADKDLMIIATGKEGNAMTILSELALGECEQISIRSGDTIIFSADIPPGRLRHMAMLLDQFLLSGVTVYWGEEQGVHVARNARQEELKLMLSVTRPKYFIPSFGEGRHIMHNAKLAYDWGMLPSTVYPLQNGQILAIENELASVIGRVEHQAVLVNRDQGERVTTFTVNERRAMSQEGLITISLVIDQDGRLVSGPKFDCGAASFRDAKQWQDACLEITGVVKEAIDKKAVDATGREADLGVGAIRGLIRETALKILRTRLQTKPVLQIVIQQLTTKHHQYK